MQHRRRLPLGGVQAVTKKQLALRAETVRVLVRDELVRVGGAGFTDLSTSCSCYSCICSIGGYCGPPPTGRRSR
jgi:hypothetical protein